MISTCEKKSQQNSQTAHHGLGPDKHNQCADKREGKDYLKRGFHGLSTSLRESCLLAIVLLLALSGHAQTIASYVGAAPAGVVNTPITWSNAGGTGTATLLYNAAAPTLLGAQYVTYKQGSAPAGVTTYSTTYNGSLAGAIGTIQAMCDDTCAVSVNGTLIGTVAGYNTVQTFTIPSSVLIDGVNKISVAVTNEIGNTGAAFRANITAAPLAKPAPKTVVSKWRCTGPIDFTNYSDSTYDLSGLGTCTKQ